MQATLYHNPRCSKSRQALAILHQHHNIHLSIIEYLSHPPTPSELKLLLQRLNCPARALLRSQEPSYIAMKLDNPRLTEDEIITIMHRHPQLIQRPIVIIDEKIAFIARPPEKILEYLG